MVSFTDIYALKAKLNKLKHQIDKEHRLQHEKDLAHKYLSKAIEYVNELQLY